MTDAWSSTKIRLFEHVAAGPSTSLLRVSGKPVRRREPGPRPTLLADDGLQLHRFAPIPSPADPRGVLRAAYSVPSAVMTPDTVFSLELGDGSVTALPAPTPGAGRPGPAALGGPGVPRGLVPGSVPAPDPEVPVDPDVEAEAQVQAEQERRSETIGKLAELSAALAQAEQASAAHEAGRTAAEAELEQVRDQLRALEARMAELEGDAGQSAEQLSAALAQAATAQESAEAAIVHAEQRAQAAEAQAQAQVEAALAEAHEQAEARVAEAQAGVEAGVESRVAEANERADSATLESAAARELNESLEQRNVQLENSIRELQDRAQSMERDVAGATEARGQLEAEIAGVRKARARSDQELEQARDSVRIMTFEREELSRQVAAFDGVAVKARERATQAEATHERLSATLQELQVWRAELERRLTATTTELGEAKSARQEDEHELKRLRGELGEAEAKFEIARAQIESLNARLANRGGQDGGLDGPASPGTDQGAELERMAAEVASLRAAQETGSGEVNAEMLDRIQMLESERAEIARRAEQIAGLLAPAERLSELARDLSQARVETESLQAAITVELRPSDAGRRSGDASGAGLDEANSALAGARAEIHALRVQLEESRAAAAEAQVELLGHTAEAEARAQAQRELTDAAAGHGRRSRR